MGLAAAAKAAAAAAAAGGSLNFSALDSKDSDKLAEQPERPWTWLFQLTPSAIIFMVIVLFEP